VGGAAAMKGDRLAPLDPPAALRRGVGSPALFAIVQGFLAASLYFGLGLVVENAHALTWVVFVGAMLFYALLVLSYVEGASLHQERGGVTVLARYAFNELWSFVAGWAILLDYLILIALTAYTTTDYAAVFWGELTHGVPQYVLSAGIIVGVAVLNLRGVGSRRYERTAIIVIADLALQLLIVVLGLALLFDPDVLVHPIAYGGAPSVDGTLFAFTLAIAAFSGLDASSGLAGEVAISRRGLRRLISVRVPSAVIPYIGLALVASSVLPRTDGRWVEAPVLGLVSAFDEAWLREPLRYAVAVSAFALLVVACNAAMLGLSRLGYSLALNRQIPSSIGRLHPPTTHPSW